MISGDDHHDSPNSKRRKTNQDLNTDHGDASDSSPRRQDVGLWDELNEHQMSEAEKVLAQTFLNRPDFPHYLLVTPPPEDLWNIFAKTMAANKKLPRNTIETRLQQPVSPPARYSLPVDRLSVVLFTIGFTKCMDLVFLTFRGFPRSHVTPVHNTNLHNNPNTLTTRTRP
ncbi:unnamed protein product [Brassica napus]|uniref:(rape) hypothetical protein n=1 Tax=Brassica napus TaxID=3708 RepID=A0A816XPY8_BRANA|nr:unnamed protein product [Brassica napus]